MIYQRPQVYIEGTKNLYARRGYVLAIPRALTDLLASHPGATVLMNTSILPEIVTNVGIPLRQTINESDLYLWGHALAAPARSAQIVFAFDGDEVDKAVKAHPEGLEAAYRFHSSTEPPATLYLSSLYAVR
jgi:hypothetical protein